MRVGICPAVVNTSQLSALRASLGEWGCRGAGLSERRSDDGILIPDHLNTDEEIEQFLWMRRRQIALNRFYCELNSPEGLSDEMQAWWWNQY